MSGYIGVSSKAREISNIYVGVNSKARKVTKGYIGDANGKAKLFYSSGPGSLEDTDWATISEISLAGTAANYWSVGDTKTITYDRQPVKARIIGFGLDRIDKAGTSFAGITFELEYAIGSTPCWSGYDGTDTSSYHGTDLYPYTNTTIYNALPSDLKSVIQSVYKACHYRISYGSWVKLKVFPLTGYELGLTGASDKIPRIDNVSYNFKYPYFTSASSRLKKRLSYSSIGTSNTQYWVRNIDWDYTNEWIEGCYINSSGYSRWTDATDSFGTSVAFCV